MAKRTQIEVDTEIVALNELLPVAGHYAAGVNAALDVLKNNLSNDAVFARYEETDEFEDAHMALLWRQGQHEGYPPSAQVREML
jgi:hypothetical protein